MEITDLKFKEVTNYRLKNTSLLHQFNILEDEDKNLLLNIFKSYNIHNNIKNNEDYLKNYNVDHEEWWETIAHKVYGNKHLWWIIALTNDVINPFEELSVGNNINIVDSKFVYQILKEIKNISEL